MAVTDQQKLDFLLKKIGYTKTKTGSVVGTGAISGTPKQPFAEAIPSPLVVANSSLWNEADSIPATPPGADTTQVKVYLAATSGLRMTADATSSGQRAYIAYSTYNNTSSARLTNWIDTQFGASYIIKVYKGDPNSGGVALSAAGSGANDGWFFDYSAGVLNFNDTNVPSGVTDTNIYIVGYRYIGQTGAPTSGISTFSYLDLTVERNLDVGVQGGISTFRNNIDANGIIEGIAGENKIPFLYSNLAALPNAGTYHGMFAHVHSEGRGYFAHAGNWLELVNKDTSGNVGLSGDLDVDGHTNLDNISVAGVSTFTGDATFSGNVSIGGTLTYEDVTNVDSVGLLTARSGIRVTGGVIEALAGENKIPSLYANMAALPSASTYHGMFAHVHSTGRGYFAHGGAWYELVNADLTGRVGTGTESYFIDRLVSTSTTATSLNVTGVTTAVTVDINGDLDVDGHTNLDNVSVSGILTAQNFDYTTATNIRIGDDAAPNATYNRNIAIGDDALKVVASHNNVAIGYAAGELYTGSNGGAVLIGRLAGNKTTNSAAVYIGSSAGRYQLGSWNTSVGLSALQGSSGASGTHNTAIGQWSQLVSLSSENTSLGARSLKALTSTSHQNTAIGAYALHSITSGSSENTVLGYKAGEALVTGSNNIIIGHEADASTTTTSNEITLGDANIKHLRVPGIGVSFNNTGGTQLGIITATELDISGDLDVDGHTNLDNVSIAGVTTMSGNLTISNSFPKISFIDSDNNSDFELSNHNGNFTIKDTTNNQNRLRLLSNGTFEIKGNLNAQEDLDVDGHTNLDNVSVAGVTTFAGNARFDSTITAGGGVGSNGQYLKTTGTGVAWASFPTLRTRDTIVASAGQTSFTFNYNVNFIDVFVNGIKLTDSEFTATNGTSIVLAVGCFVGDIVEFVSYSTISSGGGGGGGTLNNIVEDTSPQLGGNLDLFSKTINGTGGINITGVVTATTFIGDGSGLTGITASGTGVVIKNNDNTVGTAGTINFGDDLSVTPIVAGIVTVGIDTSQINLNKLNVSGISTFSDDVKFDGATAGRDITFDRSVNRLNFADNADLTFGDSNDLIIVHNGNHSLIQDAGQGNLSILSDSLYLQNTSGSEVYLRALDNTGALDLYHNNEIRLTTTSSGISIPKDLDVDGHTNLDNVSIAGVVTATTFKGALEATSGSFSSNIDANGDLDVDGHTDLDNVSVAGVTTFANDVKFDGSSASIYANWDQSGNALFFRDNSHVKFGNNNGMELTHSGGAAGNGNINNRQGGLVIRTTGSDAGDIFIDSKDDIQIRTHDTSNSILCTGGAGVKLYFAGNDKFETTTKGIQVGTGVTVETTGSATYTGIVTALKFVGDGSSLTNVSAAGINTTNLRADTLVVGENTTGVSTFHRVNIPTNKSMFFGNTNQASISYPTSGYMYLYGGIEGDMVIQTGGNRAIKMEASGNFEIDTGGNEIAIKATKNGPVELYQNGYGAPEGLRLATTGVGVTVIGITSMTDNLMVGTAATITPAGAAQFAGIVTASSFIGDGSGLTGITASGSGIIIKEGGTTVGTAGTINFVGVDVSPASAGIVTVSTATTSITDGNSKLFVNNVSSSNGNGSFEVFLNEFTSSGTAEVLNMHQPSDGYARIDLHHGTTPTTVEVNAKTVYSGYARHRLKFETTNASYGGQLDFLSSTGTWNFYSTYQGTQKNLMNLNYNSINVQGTAFYPMSNNATDLGYDTYKWRQFHVTGVNAGVVTATSVDVDDFLDVGSNIQLGNAGVITATSYRGDGSQLTGISGSQNVFQTIAVSGQSNVVADSTTDTLTLVAGSNMTITTNAGSDTITFASSGGSSTPAYTDVQVAYELLSSSSSGNGWRINGNGFANTTGNPDIYLVRGQKYRFINNSGGSHPFVIQSDASTAYNTGVTGNGSTSGNIDFIPQNSAPAKLYYNCTAHGGMLGVIYIIGEPGRGTTSAATGSIAQAAYADITIPTTGKTFALLKIAISAPAWVVLYTDTTSRTSDAAGTGSGRAEGTDPTPGSGVLAEVSTTTSGASTFKMTPGVIGWNDDGTPATQIYARVYNKRATSGSNAITVTLTTVNIEA